MIKIIVICGVGMSSGLLAEKMKIAAESQGLDVTVEAYVIDDLKNHLENTKAVLVAPQIRFRLTEVKELVSAYDPSILVDLVNMKDYGLGKGETVLNNVLAKIK